MQKEKDSLFTKALENIKKHYKLFILAVFALIVFLAGSLRVSASESTTYHYTINYGSWGTLNDSITVPYQVVLIYEDSGDAYDYKYSAGTTHYDAWNGYRMFIYEETGEYMEKYYTIKSSSGITMPLADVRGSFNGEYIQTSVSVSSDIPVFATKEDAIVYCTTGDDSGQLNKPVTEDAEGDFALLGFECNNEIMATWTGLNFNIFPEEYENIYVQVKPTYFVMLENGEEYQTFQGVGTLEVPYLDFKFEYAYEDYFIDNPYVGRCQLILNFTPIWKPSGSSTWTKGQSVVVKFDNDGNITDSILPETALVPQYDAECKLVVPYCNFNRNNLSHYIGWESVSAACSSDEIISNWLQVEFVNEDFQKAEFSSDYHWGERFFILDYYEDIMGTLRSSIDSHGQTAGWLNPTEIWVTPYYRTASGIYYGHSFVAKLDGTTVTEELETTGDPLSDDTTTGENSFQTVDKGDPVFVDGVTPDGSEGWTFDFKAVFDSFISIINTFLNSAGQVQALVNKVFSFLPGAYSTMLYTFLIILIILRVVGR